MYPPAEAGVETGVEAGVRCVVGWAVVERATSKQVEPSCLGPPQYFLKHCRRAKDHPPVDTLAQDDAEMDATHLHCSV
jgi:hypothetical protein